MKNLKLYENFADRTKIFRTNEEEVKITLWKEPKIYQDTRIAGANIVWSAEVIIQDAGIEIEGIMLRELSIMMEYLDENEDYKYHKIEIEEGSINIDQCKSEVEALPLYLRTIEINMNDSDDQSTWEYTILVGYSKE